MQSLCDGVDENVSLIPNPNILWLGIGQVQHTQPTALADDKKKPKVINSHYPVNSGINS